MFDPSHLNYSDAGNHQLDRTPHSSHMKVLKYVRSNSRVLDIGCGSGYLSKAFKDKGCHVVGVEVSALAEAAKQHCDQLLIGNIEEMTFPFPPQYFDVIVFADVLEHLKRPDLTLMRLKRFLAPKGIVIASIPNVAHARIRLNLLLGKFKYEGCGILDLTHLRFFTLDTVKQLFTESGYEITNIDYTGLGSVLKILPRWLAFQFIIVAKPQASS